MILAKGNFKSSEKIDRVCGYYLNGLLFFTSIYLVAAIFFGGHFDTNASLGLMITVFCFAASYYAMTVKEKNHQHVGTCKWLLMQVNGNRNKMTNEEFDNFVSKSLSFCLLFLMCLGGYIIFFMTPINSETYDISQSSVLFTSNEKISLSILFIYCLLIASLTIGLAEHQKNTILSEKEVLLIDEVEDLSAEFKSILKGKIIKIIQEKGFVNRHDFTEELKKIITQYEVTKTAIKKEELKENNISKLYPNLLKKGNKS